MLRFSAFGIFLILAFLLLIQGCANSIDESLAVQASKDDMEPSVVPDVSHIVVPEPSPSPSMAPVEDVISIETVHGMIEEFFAMTKEEILAFLGSNYSIVAIGVEGTYEGYYYEYYGLIFEFGGYYGNNLTCILPFELFEINGVRLGMTFSQIQECLGASRVIEGWYGGPHITAYYLMYRIGRCRYEFITFDEPDGEAYLSIYWYRSRFETIYVNELINMSLSEVVRTFGISYYSEMYGIKYPSEVHDQSEIEGFYVLGEEPVMVDVDIGDYMGYHFESRGIVFVFEEDETISFIIADKKIEINGAGTGMAFSEIMDALGDAEVSHDGERYSIDFLVDGLLLRFISCEPDGSNSTMYIMRN